LGIFVDSEKLVAARQAGMSFAELHRRAYAGEFPPTHMLKEYGDISNNTQLFVW
jgi:hypothetical protein